LRNVSQCHKVFGVYLKVQCNKNGWLSSA